MGRKQQSQGLSTLCLEAEELLIEVCLEEEEEEEVEWM